MERSRMADALVILPLQLNIYPQFLFSANQVISSAPFDICLSFVSPQLLSFPTSFFFYLCLPLTIFFFSLLLLPLLFSFYSLPSLLISPILLVLHSSSSSLNLFSQNFMIFFSTSLLLSPLISSLLFSSHLFYYELTLPVFSSLLLFSSLL